MVPDQWIKYDFRIVLPELVHAKSAVLSLTNTPYQRNWVEELQRVQLKREVAGTSRIEGADFTENELEVAMKPDVTPQELITRSQRQAHAATRTYQWIAKLPNDVPFDESLLKDVHRHLIARCDDDHCDPGQIRGADRNVMFGMPPHRGAEGGAECEYALGRLIEAQQQKFGEHDVLIQALALHYHFAAMHPFMDGNGRTARALEALMLQRAGLSDRAFIAMSNYYYDEKNSYLSALSAVRSGAHDLTPFVVFGLRGITLQCQRLFTEIKKHMERALYRNMMYDLFNRLENTRKRVIKDRQIELLKILLEVDKMDWRELHNRIRMYYGAVATKNKIMVRDINSLLELGAIKLQRMPSNDFEFSINPKWPQEITESSFFEKIKAMPRSKTYGFLA